MKPSSKTVPGSAKRRQIEQPHIRPPHQRTIGPKDLCRFGVNRPVPVEREQALEAELPTRLALAFADFERVREKNVRTCEINAEHHQVSTREIQRRQDHLYPL